MSEQRVPNAIFKRFNIPTSLMVSLVLMAPVILLNAIRFSFPLGYAGMYTLIAEKIAGAGFILPTNVPHYGPGGIPLVYPPFALYIFALMLKLGISTWTILRFVPALYTLITIIPLYYLTEEFIGSKIAGVITIVLVFSTPSVYYTHVWSAGVVRALALFFCLTGLVFYLRSLRKPTILHISLAGIFLGLLLITHWVYVVFAALVGIACLVLKWSRSRLTASFTILLIALLIAGPWLLLILDRHGFSSILVAYSSHNNVKILSLRTDTSAAIQFIRGNLEFVTGNLFLTILVIPGFALLCYRKKFQVPLAFTFMLIMGEAWVFSTIFAGIIASAFCAELLRIRPESVMAKQRFPTFYYTAGIFAFLTLAIALSVAKGLMQIIEYKPEIDEYAIEAASFVKINTDVNDTYLFVGRINEAEWFPYLLDRTPVFALWGSEWKGTYDHQTNLLIAIRECELQQSWACIENIQKEEKVSPNLLVVPNKRWMVRQLKETDDWNLLFQNRRYQVWGARDS